MIRFFFILCKACGSGKSLEERNILQKSLVDWKRMRIFVDEDK